MVSTHLFVNIALVLTVTIVLLSPWSSTTIKAATSPVSSSEVNNIGRLKIITHIENACQPKSACSSLRADDFKTHVFTFANDQYQEKGTGFPGAEKGWIIPFLGIGPEGTQYNVRQESKGGNVTYSSDCQGIMKARDNITCNVSNFLANQVVPTLGRLKIITHIENACQPKSACSSLRADDFKTHVFTFANDQYQEKGTGFPGAEKGWTVLFFDIGPEGTQYNVKQDFSGQKNPIVTLNSANTLQSRNWSPTPSGNRAAIITGNGAGNQGILQISTPATLPITSLTIELDIAATGDVSGNTFKCTLDNTQDIACGTPPNGVAQVTVNQPGVHFFTVNLIAADGTTVRDTATFTWTVSNSALLSGEDNLTNNLITGITSASSPISMLPYLGNATYSSDCQGTIKDNDSDKACTIVNNITNSTLMTTSTKSPTLKNTTSTLVKPPTLKNTG